MNCQLRCFRKYTQILQILEVDIETFRVFSTIDPALTKQ